MGLGQILESVFLEGNLSLSLKLSFSFFFFLCQCHVDINDIFITNSLLILYGAHKNKQSVFFQTANEYFTEKPEKITLNKFPQNVREKGFAQITYWFWII